MKKKDQEKEELNMLYLCIGRAHIFADSWKDYLFYLDQALEGFGVEEAAA